MSNAANRPDWATDDFVIVTSASIEEIVEDLEDDEQTMFLWLKALSQLRPTKEERYPVDFGPDEAASAASLVSMRLLVPDDEDVDRYWIDRKVAYADYACNVFKGELN